MQQFHPEPPINLPTMSFDMQGVAATVHERQFAHDTSIMSDHPPRMLFVATTIVIFFCTLSFADSIGFVPNYIDGTAPVSNTTESGGDIALASLPQLGEQDTLLAKEVSQSATTTSETSPDRTIPTSMPSNIVIKTVGIDLPVQNPKTTSISALDELLQEGPARYVSSAKLGEDGNVIIFAHSSHLPIVHNQMFRAFNKIPDLTEGDLIELAGKNGMTYTYRVLSVVRADASEGTTIDLSSSRGKMLTLVTCDTLTSKTSRFVLTAQFVSVQ